MLTLRTIEEGIEAKQVIIDEQGKVVARAKYRRWSRSSTLNANRILTEQLHQAGYDWHEVEQYKINYFT